jgi:hypothetical protein
MSDLVQKYYDQLFDRVQAMLLNPSYPDGAQYLLHIYQSGSWGTPTAWTVYITDEAPSPQVSRVQWKSKVDMQRMMKVTQPAQPTLVHTDAPLDVVAFDKLMKIGRKIRVPLFNVEMAVGFDGSHYAMVLPRPEHSLIQSEIRLQWWGNGASEWQPFTGWALKLIDLCEGAF